MGRRGQVRRLVRDVRGIAAVELAIIAPILLIAIVGIVDLALAEHRSMQLTTAARAGAQYAVYNVTNNDGIKAAVLASGLDDGAISSPHFDIQTSVYCECADGTAISCSSSCGTGRTRMFIKVSVTSSYETLFPYPAIESPVIMTESSVMRVR